MGEMVKENMVIQKGDSTTSICRITVLNRSMADTGKQSCSFYRVRSYHIIK
jgi:hypothetical protein